MTNGVTPRRWLAQANRGLAGADRPHASAPAGALDLDQLRELRGRTPTTRGFRAAFARRQARQQAAARRLHASASWACALDPASLFDVQVKRIHEYKRQLLNLLHVDHALPGDPARPARATGCRARVIFAGKAASCVPHGQADHPADPRRRRRHQQRPARRRPAEGGVRAELRRVGGRDDHARRPTCPSRSPPPAPKPRAPAT